MLEDNYRHKGMRRNLVKTLIDKGIEDKGVLEAIQSVPRHYFFDEAFLEHAYEDKAFPIGEGQTISQPYTVAIQTQLLEIKPGDKVLEIGTGSGYQCCVLLEMEAKVFTIEFNKNLYRLAKTFLQKLGYRAHFHLGDGSQGWPTPESARVSCPECATAPRRPTTEAPPPEPDPQPVPTFTPPGIALMIGLLAVVGSVMLRRSE